MRASRTHTHATTLVGSIEAVHRTGASFSICANSTHSFIPFHQTQMAIISIDRLANHNYVHLFMPLCG